MARAMQATRALAILLVLMLATAGIASLAAVLRDDPGNGYLLPFSSEAELEAFLRRSSDQGVAWLRSQEPGIVTLGSTTFGTLEGGLDYSRTNVQVEGVDESDVVKTDGTHIYLVTGDRVVILRASPPQEMDIVASLSASSLAPEGLEASVWPEALFVDAGRLAVISSGYAHADGLMERVVGPVGEGVTLLSVFDVGDPSAPERLYTRALSGSHRTSRLTADHLYLLTESSAWRGEEVGVLPRVCKEALCEEAPLSRVLHDSETVGASTFTNVLAVDLATGRFEHLSLLAGYGSTVYMSPHHLYLTYAKMESLPRTALTSWEVWESRTGHTTVYKVAVEGRDLRVVARGEVPGQLLNQFSLDEWQGFLRVATTTYGRVWLNHLYVLDGDLEVVGALEGLAPTERIYAARFLGDRAYLVTFRQVDPFYVLDVADPRSPRLLGELKIPGFSEYLHPMGDDHVLGVGRDAVEAEEGDFAWFLGLKVSLFDVRDVTNPVEAAQLLLGDRGSSSPVLHDHRAFLPIPARGLVVLPVDLTEEREGDPPWQFGTVVWRGAYVLRVGPEGLEVEGRIAHWTADSDGLGYDASVSRSLFIGSTLYTVSQGLVKATSLDDLSPVAEVALGPDGGWKG